MGQIRITPEELRTAADFIAARREEISGQVTQLNNKINEVASNWEGAAQSTFISTFEGQYLPMLKTDFPDLLTGITEQLKGAATTIEDADIQISNAFKA